MLLAETRPWWYCVKPSLHWQRLTLHLVIMHAIGKTQHAELANDV